MEEHEILDLKSPQKHLPSWLVRWQWHFIHAGIIIGLHFFVAFCLTSILPIFPRVIADMISFLLLIIIIFGTCGISIYICKKGYRWSWLTALILGAFVFFCCFVYTMSNLDYWVDIFTNKLQDWTAFSDKKLKNILEIVVVGIVYSFWAIISFEILVLLGHVISQLTHKEET